ncbi:hypothetical protein P5673_016436 [Acropora cervicornis]|uniref:Uncharacterized protein n=1 Tax=Acropora cervicornis TaxID=6130 RepID=A0AAD9V479_ACRCE|nr:hypothetical protein P5673_016436 [Acropora cervicornis]
MPIKLNSDLEGEKIAELSSYGKLDLPLHQRTLLCGHEISVSGRQLENVVAHCGASPAFYAAQERMILNFHNKQDPGKNCTYDGSVALEKAQRKSNF